MMAATAGTLELKVIAVTNNPDSRSVEYSRSDQPNPEYFAADANATDDEIVAKLQVIADSLYFQNQQDATLFGTSYTGVNGDNVVVLTVTGSFSHADSNTIYIHRSDTGTIDNIAADDVANTADIIAAKIQARADEIAAAIQGIIGTVITAK